MFIYSSRCLYLDRWNFSVSWVHSLLCSGVVRTTEWVDWQLKWLAKKKNEYEIKYTVWVSMMTLPWRSFIPAHQMPSPLDCSHTPKTTVRKLSENNFSSFYIHIFLLSGCLFLAPSGQSGCRQMAQRIYDWRPHYNQPAIRCIRTYYSHSSCRLSAGSTHWKRDYFPNEMTSEKWKSPIKLNNKNA